MFSTRVYSCNTPSLISLESDALPWIMDINVKKFLVDNNSEEFGAKYILNETMLLPPLEFSSPPNCNLFFPPMYDRVVWQYDIDADVTRGYFSVIDTLCTKGSRDLKGMSVQVPNSLFDIYSPGKKAKSSDSAPNAKKDEYNRTKPPITLEERYKGVSVFYGSVEDLLARNDAARDFPESVFAATIATKIRNVEASLKAKLKALKGSAETKVLRDNLSKLQNQWAKISLKAKNSIKAKGGGYVNKNATVALRRHAILKFLNTRYVGRVAVVDMAFNPYPMSGFPGAIIVDDEAYGAESSKTIIGMVQQVKHSIVISPSGGDATTSIVLNNARFEDEPTDVDEWGNPLYMKATDKGKDGAILSDKFDVFRNSYFPPDPAPLIVRDLVRDLDDKYYDLDDNKNAKGYTFAKDVITLSRGDIKSAENNGSYLDNEFMPNRIHKFYKEVFGHKADHFMVDSTTDPEDATKRVRFVYDTMHEAFYRLRKDKGYLLTNYEECLKFVSRDICSADAFFQGIVGASIKQKKYDDNGKATGYEFVVNEKNFNPESIHDAYFGVTTAKWKTDKNVAGLKYPSKESPKSNGLMKEEGQFSSIKETMPVTAFIQERRDAVVNYRNKVKERVQGAQFANIERYKTVK